MTFDPVDRPHRPVPLARGKRRGSSRCLPRLRSATACAGVLATSLMLLGGCNMINNWRGEDPDAKLDKLLKVPELPDLIRQAAIPSHLNFVSVEGVAAINGLPGTGGLVPPSPFRDQLIEDMKRHDVANPNQFLEQPSTALVRVQAIIPPGVRRGDPIDLRIISPPQTQATDLHGGWLMDTRLREEKTLSGMVRRGEVLVVGTGAVLTRAATEAGEDANLKIEGLVLGGGVIQKDRELGLVIRPEYRHVKMAAQLESAINQRFYFFDGTTRGGIAKAREDDYIAIEVHPRYRRNIHRLMAVVTMVVAKGETAETQHRLENLGRRLAEPTTAADAALQLEALGERAVPMLLEAIKNTDPEIRFYAAEALAYLDRSEAIEPLEQAAAEHSAFRYPALIALEGMDSRGSLDALQRLMQQSSIETRYGALRSIRRRPDGKVVLRPTKLSGVDLYEVSTEAAPFIAVSLSDRAEIACFGNEFPVTIPDFLLGPSGLVIRPEENDPSKLRVSRFRPGADDRRASVPATVTGLLTGISLVGGGYGDCVAVLRKAKENRVINCGLAIDPLPKSLRSYHRDTIEPSDPAALPPVNISPAIVEGSEAKWWQWWKRGTEADG